MTLLQENTVSSGSGLLSDELNEAYMLPASFGQERFWLLDRMDPGNPTWNVPVRFRLQGALDITVLRRAFAEIVSRHEVLRTRFAEVDGQVMQVIMPRVDLDIPVLDLRSHPQRESEVDRLSLEEAHKRFDLGVGPLFRVNLLRTADEHFVLLVTPHHSIADYISIGLISNELGALYEASLQARPPEIPKLSVQYADYALWEIEQSKGIKAQADLQYWKQQLSSLPLLELPTDHPRKDFPTYNSTIISTLLPMSLTDRLKDLASGEGVTFFNAALAVLTLVLSQYTGQTDIGISTQVAGRITTDLEPMVGMFVNNVVLRISLTGAPSARELLRRVQQVALDSLSHQDLRFEQLLRELRPNEYPSHHSLFRVNFICQRDPVKPLEFGGVKLTVIPSKSQGALYDLNVFLVLRNEGWRLACEYNTDLFEADTISRLLEAYREALQRITENPQVRASSFSREELRSVESTLPAVTSSAAGIPGEARGAEQHEVNAPEPEGSLTADHEEDRCAFPLSATQKWFWVLDQLTPGNTSLNLQIALRLKGRVEIEALKRSFAELMRRHEILRTTFEVLNGEPIQFVHPTASLDFALIDCRNPDETEREQEAKLLLRKQVGEPFKLAQSPLIRASLLGLGEDEHILAISMPHIVCDGWSNGILVRELTQLYESYSEGRDSSLVEPRIQYADFSHWQREWLETAQFDSDLAYWLRQLGGELPILQLPADKMAPRGPVAKAEIETLSIPSDVMKLAKGFCKGEEITVFTLFLAIFKIILCRWSGQTDILVGSPIAGRPPGTEEVVGPFSYPISLRTDLSGNPTLKELVHRVAQVTTEALEHKELPFGRLLQELVLKQHRGRSPFFQLYFLHQVAFVQSVQTHNLVWKPLTWISPETSFDLHLATLEHINETVARLEYNSEIFEAATARRLLSQFRTILDCILERPDTRISDVPMLTGSEASLLDSLWTPHCERAAERLSLVELLEKRACLNPTATALEEEYGNLNYLELNERSNLLASRLRQMVGGSKTIAVCSEKASDIVVGMLASLKARAAYLLLPDVEDSVNALLESRRDHIGAAVVSKKLKNCFVRRNISAVMIEEVINSGTPGELFTPEPLDDLKTPAACHLVSSQDTESASLTLSHRELLDRTIAVAQNYKLSAGERIGIVKGANIDEQALAGLISGATVRFIPSRRKAPVAEYLNYAAGQNCDVLVIGHVQSQPLLIGEREPEQASTNNLRLVVFDGEPLPLITLEAAAKLVGPNAICISFYRRNETGLIASCRYSSDLRSDRSGLVVLLDRACEGVRLQIRDADFKSVPVGVYGEICVSTGPLPDEYCDDRMGPEASFVIDSSDGNPPFRTGDIGRFLDDGRIEFSGPSGRHLNANGFRVHLSGLECALMPHPKVSEVVAVPFGAASEGQRPLVYAVAKPTNPGETERELEALASKALPGVPSALINFVDNIPRDLAGRANLALLPLPRVANSGDGAVAPRDSLESELVEIWEQLFSSNPIGIRDNFFELGGNSILALQLFTRVSTRFKRNLPLSTLFKAPTIEALARIIREEENAPAFSSLVPIRPTGHRPPLYLISGLGGNVIRFNDLAKLVDPEVPVFALQPPGLDGLGSYLTTIEDMAHHYITEIKRNQPIGPYFVAGYSFGGLVTFEIARQLAASGDAIGSLILLDTPEWSYMMRGGPRRRNWRMLFRMYQERLQKILLGRQRLVYVADGLRRRSTQLIYRLVACAGYPVPQHIGNIGDINLFAAGQYVPQPSDVKITLFRTMEEFDPEREDYKLGWSRFALEGVEVHEIPGNHDDLTSEPNVRVLAEKLNYCLNSECSPQKQVLHDSHPVACGISETAASPERAMASMPLSSTNKTERSHGLPNSWHSRRRIPAGDGDGAAAVLTS